jgi:hypothetical protein
VEDTGVRPGRPRVGREVWRPGSVRFASRRPCGQPAVLGETGRFRPVPAQAGHLARINATPSVLPFSSTGFAMYPEPPHFGQSSGATPLPPHCCGDCAGRRKKMRRRLIFVTKAEQRRAISPSGGLRASPESLSILGGGAGSRGPCSRGTEWHSESCPSLSPTVVVDARRR